MSAVVVVESPAKAKTIEKYLGPGYKVLASYGHVRDLPPKDGSVDPDQDFAMRWTSDSRGRKNINEISSAVKGVDRLILATDPDREGEAISWHILETLNDKKALKGKQVERVAFNEITRKAVIDAVANPRDIDEKMVDAYLARRALDYLVGFNLSPVLWRKLPGSRSAGRVQSVALRLICEREREIEDFISREYWTVHASFAKQDKRTFNTTLTHHDGNKLKKFDLNTEELAASVSKNVGNGKYKVANIEKKTIGRNPAPAFRTSTLQQEAARKLGFSATRTMRTAQSLYEGVSIGGETTGLITYMRTDGTTLAQEALHKIRDYIGKEYGDKYLPESPRYYKSKAKNSQEAHEAVRPTDIFRTPQKMMKYLNEDQLKLYTLIWKRTLACQMESAKLDKVAADIANEDGQIVLRANGSTIAFDGFIKVYREGVDDDPNAATDKDEEILPELKEGEAVDLQEVTPDQHFTKPPPRYTEASLVKRMEELGIGRPSTYASILQVLQDRDYVKLEQKRFTPEDRGMVVTAFLENFFNRYVQYDFTADLEGQLDQISEGELKWKQVLKEFWVEFKETVDGTKELRITEVLDALNEMLGSRYFGKDDKGNVDRLCPTCKEGQLSLKVGKMGAFIGCSNYPECSFTRALTVVDGDTDTDAINFPHDVGVHPETNQPISLRLGPYGPYVQLGEEEKPKRASLPKGLDAKDVTLEKAVELLRLPRDIGEHPETGKMIVANVGRFGPYIGHDGVFASIKDQEELFTIGINRAVDMIAEKEKKMERRKVGDHPKTGKPIYTQKARFGYVVVGNSKKIAVPKGKKAEDLTLEEALELLTPPKKAKKTAAKKKAPAKKKKTATKKTKKKAS